MGGRLLDGQGDELLALKASGRDRAEQCAWPQGVCPLVVGRPGVRWAGCGLTGAAGNPGWPARSCL